MLALYLCGNFFLVFSSLLSLFSIADFFSFFPYLYLYSIVFVLYFCLNTSTKLQYNTIIYLESITSGKVALTPEPRAHVENARLKLEYKQLEYIIILILYS